MSYFLPILILALGMLTAHAEDIGFNEHIRPILNRSCTGCHGGVVKEGKVSFIYRKEALGKGSSGRPVIVPGSPEESEMYRRIVTTDQDDLMPPPDKPHSKPLNKKEIRLIEQWIRQGAKWQQHWAYKPPSNTPATYKDKNWARQPMDFNVLQRLEHNRLSPSKAAGKAQWLRRVSLDLIGLPPSPEQLQTFEKDTSPQAYEKVVEQLLASPRFGERWASMWMDLARYSDTKGYEKDPHRDIWPYRDWLIKAFNTDLPYDIFLRDQLAGDLLKKPTADQLIATAFHRNTQTNTEGGTDDEEFRVTATIDRVNTTWTATQGITFGCTQCHSHPYEPIPHLDYYKFKDFFNNLEDCDLGDEFPKILLANDPTKQDIAIDWQLAIQKARLESNDLGRNLLSKQDQWSAVKFDQLKASAGKLKQASNNIITATGTHPVHTHYTLIASVAKLNALRFTILPSSSDPKKLPERGAVLSSLELHKITPSGARQRIKITQVFADSLSGPYAPSESLKGNASGFGGYPKLFGPRRAAFVLPSAIEFTPEDALEIRVIQKASTTGNQAVTIRNFKIETSSNPQWQKILQSPTYKTLGQQQNLLTKKLATIRGTRVPIMQNRDPLTARETRLFIGGLWLNKGELAHKGVPEILNPYNAPASNRLEMTQWLTHPQNPLTARVMANRLFAELFGKGIVETLGDFGTTGVKPSNPALLDGLAVRFQKDYRWSIKKLLKEMVLSATYRQDHSSTPQLSQLDPGNRLLARGPRNRLSAEMVRDNALAVSGLIAHRLGGPSVMPPQPDAVWQTVYNGAKWKVATGPNRYRRALYTYWKRTSPYPSMLTFDAPTRDVCTPQRIATNTPLHALVTLNDPVFLECSQALAKRMQQAHPKNIKDQIVFGFLLSTQRSMPKETLATLMKLHQQLVTSYQQEKFLPIAKTPEQAATVMIANTLLNIDDAITK